MDSLEILGFVFDRKAEMNVYWNFFLVVSTAIIATLATGKEFTDSWALKAVLTVAFAMFVVSNIFPMLSIIDQRDALLDLLGENSELSVALIESLTWLDRCKLIVFHLSADVLVVLGIWVVPWSRIREKG
ncbi:hypothetical protein [Planktotalea sp.]|uniref:hypothetical protein n=1 Tax=Planktotalea sp. TaxID=2029877 RepID=UPI003298D045